MTNSQPARPGHPFLVELSDVELAEIRARLLATIEAGGDSERGGSRGA